MSWQVRPFELADEQQALAAQAELQADDFDFLVGRGAKESWADFVDRLEANRQGVGLPDGWVASGTFGGFIDGRLVGRVGVRYELNDYLREFAGHIGYGVRPGFRGQGVATRLCRFALAELAQRGIKQALITCNETNAASRATIERCGGVPDAAQPAVVYNGDTTVLRFWVPTA